MLTFADDFKAKRTQDGQNFRLGSINGEFWHGSNQCLGHKCVQSRLLGFQRFTTECFYMKTNGTLNIMQRFIERVSLTNNYAVDTSRIGHIAIGMLFNDDLHGVNMRFMFGLCKWEVFR